MLTCFCFCFQSVALEFVIEVRIPIRKMSNFKNVCVVRAKSISVSSFSLNKRITKEYEQPLHFETVIVIILPSPKVCKMILFQKKLLCRRNSKLFRSFEMGYNLDFNHQKLTFSSYTPRQKYLHYNQHFCIL